MWLARRDTMTLKELADALEKREEEAFASARTMRSASATR
jgi:hypothetical protein